MNLASWALALGVSTSGFINNSCCMKSGIGESDESIPLPQVSSSILAKVCYHFFYSLRLVFIFRYLSTVNTTDTTTHPQRVLTRRGRAPQISASGTKNL